MSLKQITVAALCGALALAGCSRPAKPESAGTPSPSKVLASCKPAPTATYRNARHGFSAQYPKGWTARESANGDGAEFSEGKGATMTVWGSNFADGDAEREHAEALAARKKDGWYISYEHYGKQVSVMMGSKGKLGFYRRVSSGKQSAVAVEWSYPKSDKARYDATLTCMPTWVSPGDLDQAH